MNRKETTKFLTELLISNRLSDRKYYAKEVTLDYGTNHQKRIDVMEFKPAGVVHASDIEKGSFVSYEIKSCRDDVYSGNGLNFYCEENYIVTTMETYKALQEDIREGVLQKHILSCMGLSEKSTCPYFGVMVPVPSHVDLRHTDEKWAVYDNPTPLDGDISGWKYYNILPISRPWHRDRSMNELLFCMLRAKHSYSNS